MTRFCVLAFCAFMIACGGSHSPSGPSPKPDPEPTPPLPSVKDRSYTLESMTIDSGVEPFVMRPPQVTGGLSMRANGAYTLAVAIAAENFSWSKTVTGQHSFSGYTLRLVPDDSVRTTAQPFVQTVIVEPVNLSWTSETRLTVSLPIRPGAWRSEDQMVLAFVQGQTVASGKPAVLPAHVSVLFESAFGALLAP